MTQSILDVRAVSWNSDSKVALESVSFGASAGEFIAVMGRNGAGKSTLFDLIAALRTPSSGTVELSGKAVAGWSAAERARLLAHLPQSVRTDRQLTVESLVLMGRYGHQSHRWFESPEDKRVAEIAMQRCDCLEFRDRSLETLSGGERQRVLLAACLAQDAQVLLLDEPATFLDVDQQLQCFDVLRQEAQRGVCCLAVTHDVNLALSYCTRLIILANGRVAHDLSTQTAMDDPRWIATLSERMHVAGAQGMQPWVQYRP